MIEKSLDALTGAINNLADAVKSGGLGSGAGAGEAAASTASAKKAPAKKKVAAKKKAPAKKKAAAKKSTKTKKQVSDLVLEVAGNEELGRDVVIEAFSEFGATKVSDLKPADYDAFHAKLQEQIDALAGDEEEEEAEEDEEDFDFDDEAEEEDEDDIFD